MRFRIIIALSMLADSVFQTKKAKTAENVGATEISFLKFFIFADNNNTTGFRFQISSLFIACTDVRVFFESNERFKSY